MCDKQPSDNYNHMDCIQRRCNKCGLHKLLCHEMVEDKEYEWYKWTRVQNKVAEKSVTKLELVVNKGNLEVIMKELQEELHGLANHLFIAKWQQLQFQAIKSSLPTDTVLFLEDFAENYRHDFQDEVTSAHWAYHQTTIHPVVAYYMKNDVLWQHDIIFISPDLQHDATAVSKFEGLAILELRKMIEFQKIHRFTDTCAAQYRGNF